ncbi:tyrosine recombinase XerC [Nocardia sp. NPDC051570]|uniref:tyrosine recombinase XerC n=1 Tax=Nocardia sp. NPDC051570 TaxID=3364324 RepID=UPI0037B75D17
MGHVEDRWYRAKRDKATDEVVLNGRGKPVMEPTELHGKGLRYRVRYVDPDGAERSTSFPDRQKKRADDFLIEVESHKRQGTYVDPRAAKKTFRQQGDTWLKVQSDDPATREALRSRLDQQIYPVLGDKPFTVIEQPATIREWLGKLADAGLSENYKTVCFTIVSSICDSAVDDKIIRRNPCKVKSVPRPVSRSPKVVVWPEARLRAVESALPGRFRIATKLGAGAGLRQGEILGYSPDDIDRDAQEFRVERQIKTVKGVMMFALPKGGKTRAVPAADSMITAVDGHLERYPAVPVTLPWGRPDGPPVTVRLLATGDGGRLYRGDTFTKVVWQNAFRSAGLEYRNRIDGMHALRHFFASMLLANGCSIKELAEFLGHSDPGFTLKIYTHLVPDSYDRARTAVDGVLGRPVLLDGLGTA